MRGGGVKKGQNNSNVFYGRPLSSKPFFMHDMLSTTDVLGFEYGLDFLSTHHVGGVVVSLVAVQLVVHVDLEVSTEF